MAGMRSLHDVAPPCVTLFQPPNPPPACQQCEGCSPCVPCRLPGLQANSDPNVVEPSCPDGSEAVQDPETGAYR